MIPCPPCHSFSMLREVQLSCLPCLCPAKGISCHANASEQLHASQRLGQDPVTVLLRTACVDGTQQALREGQDWTKTKTSSCAEQAGQGVLVQVGEVEEGV